MLKRFVLCFLISFNFGFLLDENSHSNSLQSSYLTIGDKIQINHDMEKVRNELKNDINLLTSQLKTRLVAINDQIGRQNATKDFIESSQQQIFELENNFTKLTQSLDTLKKENSELKVQLSATKIETTEMKQSFDTLKQENSELKVHLSAIKNETHNLNRELKSLQELKNIQQLQSMATLQEKVRVVDSSVNSLLSHEQARNQDFLALYNITIQSKNQLENFQKLTSDRFLMLETFENKTLANLQEQVSKNAKKVAVTGCSGGGTVSSGNVIRFPTIRYSDGITNLASFKSSGKFTCEVPGLYHISAVIFSETYNADFYIYKNGSLVSHLYVSNSPDNEYYSSTAVIALDLQAGDTLWVQTGIDMKFYGGYSCLTIIKVK